MNRRIFLAALAAGAGLTVASTASAAFVDIDFIFNRWRRRAKHHRHHRHHARKKK